MKNYLSIIFTFFLLSGCSNELEINQEEKNAVIKICKYESEKGRTPYEECSSFLNKELLSISGDDKDDIRKKRRGFLREVSQKQARSTLFK